MSRDAPLGPAGTDLVLASLEAAAELGGDIVPLVYRRLFDERPDLLTIFATETAASPRSGMGNMVNEILRLLLAGSGDELENEAQAAVVFHVGWGLDFAMYSDVLSAVMHAVEEACGTHWTEAMARAWHERLEQVLGVLRRQYGLIEGPAGA